MNYNSIDEIKSDFIKICLENKVHINENIEFKINNRFTSTLGRVSYRDSFLVSVQFNKNLLKVDKEKAYQIVLHEAAHVICDFVYPDGKPNIKNGLYETILPLGSKSHGHDACFKKVCKAIGCKEDMSRVSESIENFLPKEEKKAVEEKKYKYTIYCAECGKIVAQRQKKCKLIKEIEEYSCSLCGGKLKVVQNF